MIDEREERVRQLLPMVRMLARRVQRMVPQADYDDLIGDGSIGVLRAVDNFDPNYGVTLEHYARRIVLGTMLNGIRRLDPVSERVRRALRNSEHRRFAIAQECGTLPTTVDMERRIPGLRRARAEAYRCTPLSLDTAFPQNERLEPDTGSDPQVILAERADYAQVRMAVAALPPRQRAIVLQHYYRERSLRSLGKPFGVSPQRVSQLHVMAVERLRDALVGVL
jgi:RNA polymerase sigma factor for flagellar operon FliA